ncbi:MAG: hypothetical protein IJE16_03305 [Ruminococcus sp.]|nr:hypothetical protein [Ruminococcus sp.]
MKKFIAILMTILMLVAVTAVSASAATSAETEVSVNKGDEVIYSLKLTVPEKVVGCDFSVYFDSSVLQVQEVADFTGSFDEDEHRAVINPNLKDEVIGNWSILNGVAFDNKSMVTVKFKAMAKADTHIKYYIRYLYPESLEQFTTYTFKCDVQVNGKDVVKDAAPELNVKDEQSQGLFINSVTGDSNDANVNMAEKTPSNNGDISEKDLEKPTDKPKDKNTNKDKDKDTDKSTEKSSENSDTNTSISENGGVSSPDSVTASPSQTGEDGGIFTSIWFWIVIVLIVAGGGIGAFVVYKKKNTVTE